jgi:TM2 domain-containing membrane protein YozV
MYDTGKAYLLWLLSLVGVCGVHRLYLGKIGTGILWIVTGGLFGIGALYDLVTLPGQVREANIRKSYELALQAQARGYLPQAAPPRQKKDSIERIILRCARKNSGFVTASEVALDGDVGMDEAKAALDKLAGKGFAEMRIRTNGVIVYVFAEFQKDGAMDFADV